MNKSKLARDLDISRTMLYKLEAKGMPTDSLEAAIEWRRKNLDVTQTKQWRIDGNTGLKHQSVRIHDNFKPEFASDDLERDVLTDVVPSIWFEQPGWLGSILKDHGVKITAEQLLKVQQCLFMVYMDVATEYLDDDGEPEPIFYAGPILQAKPGDEIYPSLMARLNQIL